MSTRWVAPCSRAYQSASARTRRPSASVFVTSIVLPFTALTMSPGRYASPPGMFSQAATTARTRTGIPSSRDRAAAASTAAPPPMSVFMSLMRSGRLDRDPAGVERDRLADEPQHELGRAGSGGSWRTTSSRGGCALPRATAANAFMPRARMPSSVEHLGGNVLDRQRELGGEVGQPGGRRLVCEGLRPGRGSGSPSRRRALLCAPRRPPRPRPARRGRVARQACAARRRSSSGPGRGGRARLRRRPRGRARRGRGRPSSATQASERPPAFSAAFAAAVRTASASSSERLPSPTTTTRFAAISSRTCRAVALPLLLGARLLDGQGGKPAVERGVELRGGLRQLGGVGDRHREDVRLDGCRWRRRLRSPSSDDRIRPAHSDGGADPARRGDTEGRDGLRMHPLPLAVVRRSGHPSPGRSPPGTARRASPRARAAPCRGRPARLSRRTAARSCACSRSCRRRSSRVTPPEGFVRPGRQVCSGACWRAWTERA